MPEPTYVKAGDEFGGDYETYPPETDFQKRILDICGKQWFDDPDAQKRVRILEKKMGDYTLGMDDPPKYPKEYVEAILKWADEKNQHGVYPIIKLPTILRTITDKYRLTKWFMANGGLPSGGQKQYGTADWS
jgi:hypothetical protein